MDTNTLLSHLIQEIEKTVYGKRHVIELTLTALLADGHIIFEDIPGVGKTLLVKSFARVSDQSFSRIQFTPDVMPSDILGLTIYSKQTNAFEFIRGPIFNTIILADEINRTSPKTQSALLEAMSEKQVTLDGINYPMDSDFFVLATQNPLNFEGTYPLPEAQLDRFMMQLHIGYPEFEDELRLIKDKQHADKLETIQPILNKESLKKLKLEVDNVQIHDDLYTYALKLVRASRHHPEVKLGISPRGAQQFLKAGKAYALIQGRSYCIPQDFITLLKPVFGHRLQLINRNSNIDTVLKQIQGAVEIPNTGL